MKKNSKYIITCCLLAGLCLLSTLAWSSGPLAYGADPGKMHDGKREMIFRAIARHLVHPGILAFHQKDLNLTQEQKDYLKMQIQETRSVLSGMEWELAEAVGGLVSILEQDTIDEQEAQNQLDTILDMENAIKKERLGLMIRIKNSLTEEQLKIIEDNRSDWIQEIVDHKHSREKQSPGQH